MLLNTMTSNILHQALSDEINIVYYPSNSIFDQILYMTDHNFFIFNDIKSVADNCKCVNSEYVDMYQYDICCTNQSLTYKDIANIASSMHIHPIILEHRVRDPKLKKEDLFILNQQTQKIKKIFFDRQIADTWGFSNVSVLNYGIPTDTFKPLNNQASSDILIAGQSSILTSQLRQYVTTNLNMKCDVVADFSDKSVEDINSTFNNYRIFIDLNNNLVDCLCSSCCGLHTVSLTNLGEDKLSETNIRPARSVEDIVSIVSNIQNHNLDNTDVIRKHIEQHYNFDTFKSTISNIFTANKREACIL
jgi:hypothetical protein